MDIATAAQAPRTIADLPRATVDRLLGVAKAIDKNEVRPFGRIIRVENGSAVWSDGFGLLKLADSALCGVDTTLDRNLLPAIVKFPEYGALLDRAGAQHIDASSIRALADCYRAPRARSPGRQCLAVVGADGRTSLQFDPSDGDGFAFNLALLAKFEKALPKTAHLDTAEVQGDRLLLGYEDQGARWTLLLAAMQLKQRD